MELEIKMIGKAYNTQVLENISFKLENGIYGLLGPNGAGKSTLIRLICDIEKPDSGQILWQGESISSLDEEYRGILGYVPQRIGYYPDFTAWDFLEYMALLKGVKKEHIKTKITDVLQQVNLSDIGSKKIKNFSGGMKQRLGIAQAILNDPKLLILDEPTVGLDVKERMEFKQFLSDYGNDRIILFATHIVSDVEDIGNEIILLKSGRLIKQGNVDKLLENLYGKVWNCECTKDEAVLLRKKFKVSNMKIEKDRSVLRVVSEDKPINSAEPIQANLQDLYLYMYNEVSENLVK